MFRRLCSNINSRLVRPLTAFVVAAALSFSCIVPAHALDPATIITIVDIAVSGVSLAKEIIELYLSDDASETEKQAALQGYKDHWVTPDEAVFSGSCVLSYEALSQVVLDLNNNGQPARIVKTTIGGSADSYYVVQACGPFGYTRTQSDYGFGATSIWNNTGYYYSTTNGRVFLAQYDTSSLVNNLYLTVCTVMNTKVNNISAAISNSIEPNIEAVAERLTSIDETLTSVVSEGMVKVDNSDVVAAIKAIPAFDDTAIISAIQSIPAFDDTAIINAIKAIPSYNSGALYDKVSSLSARIYNLRTAFYSLTNYFDEMEVFYSDLGENSDYLFSARQRTYDVFESLYGWMDFYTFTGDGSLDFWQGLYSNVGDISAIESSIRNSVVPAIKAVPAFDDADVISTMEAMSRTLAGRCLNIYQSSERVLVTVGEGNTYLSQILDKLNETISVSTDLTPIVTRLDTLIEKTSDTVVNVIGDNTYVPGVLYLDDDNGVVNTTKNGVSIFGDLLRWLWQNVFDGAFEAADITKLDGLFYDPTEVTTDGS